MTTKLFTHTDLDGVGCAIVAYSLLHTDVDVEYCDYHEINDKVREFIESGASDDFKQVFITDISVDEDTAKLINGKTKEMRNLWRLVDHHGTAEWLDDKYRWAWVQSKESGVKTSGTSMFYDYLSSLTGREDDQLKDFTEKVRRYDTWDWKNVHDDHEAKQLNDLLGILGRDRFVGRFTSDVSVEFTETERLLLELEQESINAYIERKKNDIAEVMFRGYLLGVVYAERYQSELGNALNKAYPEYSAIAMINAGQSGSLRTIHDEVDVSELAKVLGGGGHPKAAGFPLPDDDYRELIFFEEDE